MEEDQFTEEVEESEEDGSCCQECEMYQQRIYELNGKLRSAFGNDQYRETKRTLDNLVQVQLRHQREHL